MDNKIQVNQYIFENKEIPASKENILALVEVIKEERRERDSLVRENEMYREQHKAWRGAVYMADPFPGFRGVQITEYGDYPGPIPQVKKITDLLDLVNDLQKKLKNCM